MTASRTPTEELEHAKELHGSCVQRVSALRLRNYDLRRELKGISDLIVQGKGSDEAARVPELTEQLAQNQRELNAEEEVLATAERALAAATYSAKLAECEAILTSAEAERANFLGLFREGCLCLGRITEAIERLNDLGSDLKLPLRGSLLRDRIVAVALAPDPLRDAPSPLLDTHSASMGVGYDWNVRLVPLFPRFKNQPQGDVCENNSK